MNGHSLVEMVKSNGKKKISDFLIESMDLPAGDKNRIEPANMSQRELWEAFVGPVGETLQFAQMKMGLVELSEAAVDSSLYQILAGKIIANTMIDSYNRVPHIGDDLVTVRKTKQRFDKVSGWTPTQGVKTVLEGQPYEDTGFGHKFIGTGDVFKKGRILPITEEAIFYDETSSILEQAEEMGKDARLDREETILKAILGIDTSYFPTDVGTALYTAAPQLLGTNPLTDWRNIESAELSLADTVDEEGNSILIRPQILLVPAALNRTALRILSATEVREDKNIAAGSDSRVTLSANPVFNAFTVRSSPAIHTLQVAAGIASGIATSSWWLGDFKKQFVWKEIWPLQVSRAKPGHSEEFRSDIKAQFKVRYYGGIYAKDKVYVMKNTAA